MANNSIDQLSIQISADSSRAIRSLDALSSKLRTLSQSLIHINGTGLRSLSNGITQLTSAMQGMRGIDGRQFTALANSLNRLSSTNSIGISNLGRSLTTFSNSVSQANISSSFAQNLYQVANSVSRLGSKTTGTAITYLPTLANSLRNFINVMNSCPPINQNVIALANALANLSAQGRGVGVATRYMNSAMKNAKSTMQNTTTIANRQKSAFMGLAQSFGKFYASCFLLIRGIKALGRAINKSMDYVETYNYFNVTLDKISKESASDFQNWGYDSAEEYADSFRSRLNELTEKMTGFSVGEDGMLGFSNTYAGLGLDVEQLMNYQAKILQVTNSVGLLGETSNNTAEALSMLAADISSFTNTSMDTVMTNLQSGLIGQSRALYKYGVDITNATLSEYALANGVSKSVSEMSQSEKMQLRLLAILDQTKVAWGDQANTLNSVANQFRVFKAQISNLARIIGSLFLPLLQKLLPYLNAIVITLQKAMYSLGMFLFGDNWSSIMDGISSGVGDIDDSTLDLEDSLDDADSSAKKLKNTLMGFDELNVINTSNSGSTGIGAGIDLSQQIKNALSEYQEVWNKALEESENKAKNIADSIQGKFNKVFTNIGNGFAKAFDGKGLKDTQDNLSRIEQTLKNIFASDEVQTAMENLVTQSQETFGSILGAVTETYSNITAGVTGGVADAGEELEDFNKNKLVKILDNLTGIKKITQDLAIAFSNISKALNSKGFQNIVEKVTELANIIVVDKIEKITGVAQDWYNWFAKPIIDNSDKIRDLLDNIYRFIDHITKPLEKIAELMKNSNNDWENSSFHKLFSTLSGLNSSLVGKVLDRYVTVLSVINDILDAILDKDYSGFTKRIVDYFNNRILPIVNIIGGLYNTISGTDNFKKYEKIQVPSFSNGGYVRSADMFMANENGVPELVGTLGGKPAVASGNEITGISDTIQSTSATTNYLLGELISAVNRGSVIEIDGKAVFNSVANQDRIYRKSTGRSKFAY